MNEKIIRQANNKSRSTQTRILMNRQTYLKFMHPARFVRGDTEHTDSSDAKQIERCRPDNGTRPKIPRREIIPHNFDAGQEDLRSTRS